MRPKTYFNAETQRREENPLNTIVGFLCVSAPLR